MMSDFDFDVSSVEPAKVFSLLPAGDYVAHATRSEWKEDRNNNSKQYLEIEFDILDGEFSGRKLFANLRLKGYSDGAIEYARRQIASLAAACGIHNPRNSEEFHFIPVIAHVVVVPPQYVKGPDGRPTDIVEFKPKNEIKAYLPVNGSPVTSPRPAAAPVPRTSAAAPTTVAPAAQRAAVGGATPPWRSAR